MSLLPAEHADVDFDVDAEATRASLCCVKEPFKDTTTTCPRGCNKNKDEDDDDDDTEESPLFPSHLVAPPPRLLWLPRYGSSSDS